MFCAYKLSTEIPCVDPITVLTNPRNVRLSDQWNCFETFSVKCELSSPGDLIGFDKKKFS